MSFSIKKLSKKSKSEKQKDRKFMIQMGSLIGGVLVVFLLSFAIYKTIKSLDFSTIILSSFSTPLQEDTTGKINILLVGVGGEGHDGPNLTDTLMVAHIDPRQKTMTLLSIPRDLYITSKITGGSKINAVYSTGLKKYGDPKGMGVLIQTVENMTNLSIPYYIKVDFKGFVSIVDSLGGVDVNVEKRIYDSSYPLGYGYQTFKIAEGPQTLDGETALKYVRSRHGIGNERGDYDRAERQQQVLYGLKEKAFNANVLTNTDKLKELYSGMQEALNTNLSLPEMLALAQVAQEIKRETIYPLVFNDNTQSCGGLLYTPPREAYGGDVSLPIGQDDASLQLFAQEVVPNIALIKKSEGIKVVNGTKVTGLAMEVSHALARFCFENVATGNTSEQNLNTSAIYYDLDENGDPPPILPVIKNLLSLPVQEGIPKEYLQNTETSEKADAKNLKGGKSSPTTTDLASEQSVTPPKIVIELGKDYLQLRKNDPFRMF